VGSARNFAFRLLEACLATIQQMLTTRRRIYFDSS